jgi:hypothetical protein
MEFDLPNTDAATLPRDSNDVLLIQQNHADWQPIIGFVNQGGRLPAGSPTRSSLVAAQAGPHTTLNFKPARRYFIAQSVSRFVSRECPQAFPLIPCRADKFPRATAVARRSLRLCPVITREDEALNSCNALPMCADGFFGSAQRKHKRRSPRNRAETVLPY